jgi:isohexenylglutaconyl-CoA hydratase
MKLPVCQTLALQFDRGVLHLTFNRPKARNAMSRQMVEEMQSVFSLIDGDSTCRALVLRGADGFFCAGGDIKDMAKARGSIEAITELNRLFGKVITQLDQISQTVVAVVEGAAMGGGFGLVCVADVVLAHNEAKMALPETSLGIPPAQIAPFLVRRLGLFRARRLALTGAKIRGKQLREEGLADEVYNSTESLELGLEEILKKIMRCGPNASAVTKRLLNAVENTALEELLDDGAASFAHCVLSPEGMEGTMAFISKKSASWAKDWK